MQIFVNYATLIYYLSLKFNGFLNFDGNVKKVKVLCLVGIIIKIVLLGTDFIRIKFFIIIII